jgi:alkylhydroperoxidase family enzyme
MSTPATSADDLRSRLPDPSQHFPQMGGVAAGMFELIRNGLIPQSTISLVQLRAGQIVGSTYHTIRQTGDLRQAGESEERITAVATWRDSPHFTDAERVALELVESVLTPNPSGERVADDLFAKASAHYGAKELWTLTLAIAQICYFIPVALIARPIPGRAQHYSE